VNAIKEIASITGAFKASLIAWLGSAGNGIGNIFAETITATNVVADSATFKKLCVTKSDGTPVCITGDALDQILTKQSVSPAASSAPVTAPPAPSNAATSTATTTVEAPSIVPDYNATTTIGTSPSATTSPTAEEATTTAQ
jgi:hypothetical protein